MNLDAELFIQIAHVYMFKGQLYFTQFIRLISRYSRSLLLLRCSMLVICSGVHEAMEECMHRIPIYLSSTLTRFAK